MKTLRFLSQLVLTAVLISGTAINASAQKKEDWKQKIMQEKIASIPMRRTGEVEDVAAAYLFLASDDASFVNATTLIVDGGMS